MNSDDVNLLVRRMRRLAKEMTQPTELRIDQGDAVELAVMFKHLDEYLCKPSFGLPADWDVVPEEG